MPIPQDAPLTHIDVSDPALYEADEWQPVFERLRREDPVHYCANSAYGPYWSVTRYLDIQAVELDPGAFSAEIRGNKIDDPPPGARPPTFIRMDPPKHTEQRRAVAPIATPSNLEQYEAAIRRRTSQVLDELPRNETFNWVDRVSIELTTTMLAVMLDVPWETRDKLAYWSDVVVADINAPDAVIASEAARIEALTSMGEYFQPIFEERKKLPLKMDLISMLGHSPATRDMSFWELTGNIGMLIVAGNDTTRNTMTGGAFFAHRYPAEFDKIRTDRSLVSSFVAETIRYQSPIIYFRRTATRDTELGDKTIKGGDKVVMWYVSGNRDETVIDDPDAFIADRAKPRRHVAFGAGIHRCVGDRLAELQLRILWEEILAKDLRFEVVGEPKRVYSNFIRGFRDLPVRVEGSDL